MIPPHRFRSTAAALILCALSSCAPPQPSTPAPDAVLPPAPWSAATVQRTDVPTVYFTQWRTADNRASCALVALTQLGSGAAATSRAATFSGGWAVAYDLPETRSAFGIAGTGSKASDPSYSGWPNRLEWSDGSRADYGLEGGTGPNNLAYLRIAGEACLYNVWSRIGKEHLEVLLNGIRRVDTNAER